MENCRINLKNGDKLNKSSKNPRRKKETPPKNKTKELSISNNVYAE